ncbi:phosphatase PAP2 family protein [Brevibacillus agri]|uniref:phosphatase PAP2 family protein n=1 Tax=Brevibacillus agri TaxID=51101 RepID=UPI00046F9240|nr:phosphatase PAP2 family protein [Brevibacillus agri]
MKWTAKESGLIVCGIVFAVLGAWMFRQYIAGEVAGMDQAAFAFFADVRSEAATTFFQMLTLLGNATTLAPLGVVLVAAFFFKGHKLEAVVVLLTLGVSKVANELLKLMFARPRPSGFNLIELPDSFSFPSGHAMIAPCFYLMLALLIARWYQEKSWSAYIQPIALVVVVLLAASRVYLGVHYLSDVLTGFCLSLCWYFLVRWGYERRLGRRDSVVDPIPQSR